MAKGYEIRFIELRAVVFGAGPKGETFLCVRETNDDSWGFPGSEFLGEVLDDPEREPRPLTILVEQLRVCVKKQIGTEINILGWLAPVLETRGEEGNHWCRIILYAVAEPLQALNKHPGLQLQFFPLRRLLGDFEFYVAEKVVEAHDFCKLLKKREVAQ
ncbi:MAG: hypothetical protein V1821_00165 [bacterium]